MKGIKRFRQAIKNQQDFGNGEFRLTYHDAEEIAAEIEEEFGWAKGVPAPVDADGEVVPLTTKVMYDDDGKEVKLDKIKLVFGFATSWYVMKMLGGSARLDELYLHRPDSWERLEEDIQAVEEKDGTCEYFGRTFDDSCDGCSAHNIPNTCPTIALRDVLRRAKALAERDAKGAER